MSKWTVTLPFAGFLTVEVKADSEEAAIREALGSDLRCTIAGDGDPDLQEFDVYRLITQGNVCYVPVNAAEAEETDPSDDDE